MWSPYLSTKKDRRSLAVLFFPFRIMKLSVQILIVKIVSSCIFRIIANSYYFAEPVLSFVISTGSITCTPFMSCGISSPSAAAMAVSTRIFP